MNSKTTFRLLALAVALFAFICLVERRLVHRTTVAGPLKVFPKLRPEAVTLVEIGSTNQSARAERTNGQWRLISPAYPAQTTPVEALVKAMAEMREMARLSAREVSENKGGLKAFGLEPPVLTVSLQQPDGRVDLLVGIRTPLANQFYAQVLGEADVRVVDGAFVAAIPKSPLDWRSTALIQTAGLNYDRIQIKTGSRLIEVEKTNGLWKLIKPLPARADNQRIEQLLQTLGSVQVSQFVTDSPAVDLERFGLQQPDVEFGLFSGANRVASLEFGASPTNDPGQVYARRLAQTNIVLVPKEIALALRQPYKAFHDPRLLTFNPASVDRVVVQGKERFSLDRTNGQWRVSEPLAMEADPMLVGLFLTNLASLEIVDFIKDVPSQIELRDYQLEPSSNSYALFATVTNADGLRTNLVLNQVDFGTNQIDIIAARRRDETPIYATRYGDVLDLPKQAFELRNRQIWSFASSNISAITSSFNARTARVTRDQSQAWSPDPVVNAELEETLYRLGQLQAVQWVSRGDTKFKSLGFTSVSFGLQIEVTQGAQPSIYHILFGRATVKKNIYASVVMPGEKEPVIFEFPGGLYADILRTLGPLVPAK